MSAMVNRIGQRFGRLVVIGPSERKVYGRVFWKCLCDCGGVKDVAGSSLKSGWPVEKACQP